MIKTAKEAFEKIKQSEPKHALRVHDSLSVGQVAHQGDVYLMRVKANHPRGDELGTRQVAIGTTVGSRHIMVGPVRVYRGKKLPKCVDQNQARLGPVVVVEHGEEDAILTHPEHAHHCLPRARGTYQVIYQLDMRTMRAVQD